MCNGTEAGSRAKRGGMSRVSPYLDSSTVGIWGLSGNEGTSASASAPDSAKKPDAPVKTELSYSGDVFTAVDDFFNLSSSGRLDSFSKLSKEDQEAFFQMVAKLGAQGYMGYELVEIDGEVVKQDIDAGMVDSGRKAEKVHKIYDPSV